MLHVNLLPSTSYDAENKVWRGAPAEHYYAESLSIGEIIFEELRRHPKNIAQISASENTVLTREEILLNAIRVSVFLRNLNITQHDIIGISARNTTHLAAVAYACFFNGTAFHAVNPKYDEETIKKLFSITKPKLIFCDGDYYEIIKNGTTGFDPKIFTMKQHIQGITSILDILKTPIDENFRPSKLEHGINQNLAILSTSGTTGTPKAVTISNSRKIFDNYSYLTSQDVQYVQSTLDWITGVISLITTAVYSTKCIISEEPFNVLGFLNMIDKYKITWIIQPPAHIGQIVNYDGLSPEKLDSVRYYSYGGGKCSMQTQKKLAAILRKGKPIYVYGFTEIGSAISQNGDINKKPNSVGRIMPGRIVKILDNNGESLGPNQQGEVCVSIGQHWNGYYDNENETRKMQDVDGWFHSGDLGYFDEDNYLYIVDRKKEMLKYLGMMYYPNEIEDIINQMPEVSEVCVFGIWNEFEGDAAAAAVVPKMGYKLSAQEVVDYVAKMCAVKYKHLNAGAVIVDQLERTAIGKINRAANKAKFLESRN